MDVWGGGGFRGGYEQGFGEGENSGRDIRARGAVRSRVFVGSFCCGGWSVFQSRSKAEMPGKGMSETSSPSASSPPLVESQLPASSSSAESGSASFPSVFFIADLEPSSGAKVLISTNSGALLLSEQKTPPPHRFSACVSHFAAVDIFICLSRIGSRLGGLSRAVFCAVTLVVNCAIAIWEGRGGRTDRFALPHFRV